MRLLRSVVRAWMIMSLVGSGFERLLGAEAPASQQGSSAVVLRMNSNLVLVDVVATDHDKPVHGLRRERFHVFENGVEQAITSFDEHHAPGPVASPARRTLPPFTWTNLPEHPESPVVNVLLLDGLNTQAANQADVRRQMLHYLGSLQPGMQMAVFTLGTRLRQLTGFTTDRDVLSAALKSNAVQQRSSVLPQPEDVAAQNEWMAQIAANFTPGEIVASMQQFQADDAAFKTDRRVQMTLEALDDLARYLSAIPGRKNLIWFSGSFPVALDPDPTQMSPFMTVRNYAGQLRETSNLLAAARVAVYPIDARGLMNLPSLDAANSSDANQERSTGAGMREGASVPTFSMTDRDADNSRMAERTTMQQIAAATGGREFINTNDFEQAIAGAIDDGSSYYTIGYVPAVKKLDGSFRRLSVRVDDAQVRLAYRRGYYADAPAGQSGHKSAEASLLTMAALRGAPLATQVVFVARVLPADDPSLKGEKMPEGPAGAMHVKGAARRFAVDFRVDGHTMAFSPGSDGVQHAQIEFVLIAYDGAGQRVNYLDKLYYLDMKPDAYAQAMTNGITARLALDVPHGPGSLRLVVYDPVTNRAGSLEMPLAPGH